MGLSSAAKLGRLLLIIGAALVLSPIQGEAAPQLLSTNLAGVMTFAPPPPGFDPLKATDSELTDHGFPPHPATGDRAGTERWERMVRSARHWVKPVLQQTLLIAGPRRPPPRETAPLSSSTNWAGIVIQSSATRYGPGSFTSMIGWFNVPIANQAFGVCNGNWDSVVGWAGIDGQFSRDVFQAGFEADAYCAGQTVQKYYSPWYEWYPGAMVRVSSLPISPGDVFGVGLVASSPTTGFVILADGTTAQYSVIAFSAPAGTNLIGDSAEWIEERPANATTGALLPLTNFVEAWISDESATELGSSATYTPGSLPYGGALYLLNMVDNTGATLAYATGLGGNLISLRTAGSAY